jgi:hypothetical protein
MRSFSVEGLSLIDFLLDQILLPKEVVAHLGVVVPHIISELLGHKHVSPFVDLATPIHQASRSKVCKLANAKAFMNRKPTTRFTSCRAQCALRYPSLVPEWVVARRGFSSCCGRYWRSKKHQFHAPTC